MQKAGRKIKKGGHMKIDKTAGYTFIELIVVVAIIGVMLGLAGLFFQTYHDRYEAEAQVRRMHIDMLNARARAFFQNKACFVTVTADGYQITEDTNNSGGASPDAGDTALWPAPKRLRYQSHWTGTFILEGRGTISKSTGGLLSSNPLSIRFDTAGAGPQYDCISVGPTRLNVGKWNGAKCAPI